MDERGWDELIGALYAAAIDAESETRLLLAVAAAVGGSVASMWRATMADQSIAGRFATTGPAEALAEYQERFHRHDPWAIVMPGATAARVVLGAEVIADPDMAASLYYNEFAVRYEMFHLIGAMVPLGARTGVLSIVRGKGVGAFEGEAVAGFRRLLPHVAGAFRLREAIDGQLTAAREAAFDGALAALGVAALVVDGHGAVLRMNPAAEGLAVVREAVRRRGHGERRMEFAPWPGHERAQAAVAAAAAGGAGGLFRVVHPTGDWTGTASVLPPPLAALGGYGAGRVLVVLRRADGAVAAGEIGAVFGLTEAEAAAAALLAAGATPGEIAAARGVRISTVRTQLQRAQEKAGCRSLRDLARVLGGFGG